MPKHQPVSIPDLKIYWRRAVAEFRAWHWKLETPGKAVIWERDAAKARPMHGGEHILVELGEGVRWRCTACRSLPHKPMTSLHWTNWGRVELHMILHHGGRPR